MRVVCGLSVCFFFLQGCVTAGAHLCRPGEQVYTSDTLYFGTGMREGVVSPQQWDGFLSSVVTVRFPQGLTVWPVQGQWRSADSKIVHETSYVLSLVHPDDAVSDAAVTEIVTAYKTQFQQESILRLRSTVCARF
jgi:hypothetical protein